MTLATETRLSHAKAMAVLPAEDLERARRFWGETLGFKIEPDPQGGAQFIVHAGAGTSFLVYERARTVAEHTAATFIVDDLDATVSELRAHGIEFAEYDMPGLKTVDGIATLGSERSAWFTDPEGNIIAVASMN